MFIAIDKTLSILDSLQKQVLTQNVFRLLQDLLKSLHSAIEEINVALKLEKFKQFHSKTKLCASQLTKTLPSLVDIVKGVQNAAHKEVSDFLIEKIRWCLLEVLRLFSGGGSDDDGEPSGMFVKIMDDAILAVQKETCIDSTFRKNIDELLCQALTIAKLSSNEDYEEISAGCKNVLSTLLEFSDGYKPIRDSLKSDALLTSLEILERRVNIAVLRLFLQLSADPNLPLKQLTLKALDKRYKPRHISDLSADLDLLDLYCEQIQLMGHFAVACSNDSQLKIKILCCLASIEFCENFFRTSMEDFYINPSDYNKKGFFKFIVDEYQKEMKELTYLIDCVVDTETFVQVALNDLNPLAQDIKESIGNNIFNKRDAEVFLSRCVRLVKHMHSAQDESFSNNLRVIEAIKEFECSKKQCITITSFWKPDDVQISLQSCVDLLKQYQTCLRTNVLNLRSMQEVISRMDASLFIIHKISCLIVACHSTQTTITNTPKIRQRKIHMTMNNVISTPATPDSSLLKPYLTKVKQTPRLKSSLYVVTPKKTPRHYPANALVFAPSNSISDVLDNIQDFSETFTPNVSMKSPQEDEESEAEGFSDSKKSSSRSAVLQDRNSLGESHFSVDTVGRLEDLMLLDNKINKLKMV